MNRQQGLVMVLLLGTAACGGGGGGSPTAPTSTYVPSPRTLTGITVAAVKPNLLVGESTTFTVTAVYSDGSTQVLNSPGGACEVVTNTVITQSADCTITAVGPGTATQPFTFEGQTATLEITVTQLLVRGWVSDLLKGGWVENAVVRIGNTVTATTGADGKFEAEINEFGRLPVVIEASGFHKAESQLDVSNEENTYAYRKLLTTDTSYFDLNFFDHVFRNKGERGTRRWATMPRVEIWTKQMECLETYNDGDSCKKFKATATAVPSHFETWIRSVINNDYPDLTGDVLNAISITTKSHAAGTVLQKDVCAQPDLITAAYMTPGSSNYTTRYSYAYQCRYTSGEMRGSAVHINSKPSHQFIGLYRHELAHSLGWRHPDGYDSLPRPSVMDRNDVITWWDKRHGSILYKDRTAGSLTPDKDLPGNTINYPDPTKALEFFGPDFLPDVADVALGQGLFRGPFIIWEDY